MVESGKKISELGKGLVVYPQMLHNIRMKPSGAARVDEGVPEGPGRIREGARQPRRILVRYSGTEPLLRIMAEGENLDEVEAIVKALGEKAKEESP